MSGDSGNEDGVGNEKSTGNSKNLYEMRIDVEKIAQGVRCAVETVKEWLGLSKAI